MKEICSRPSTGYKNYASKNGECPDLDQEFGVSNVSPLEIINDWLARRLIVWDDDKQAVLEDWRRCDEHAQPKDQIKSFVAITGRTYPAY